MRETLASVGVGAGTDSGSLFLLNLSQLFVQAFICPYIMYVQKSLLNSGDTPQEALHRYFV